MDKRFCTAQNVAGENFAKFGKLHIIHQYFTQPNLSLIFCETIEYPVLKILHVRDHADVQV